MVNGLVIKFSFLLPAFISIFGLHFTLVHLHFNYQPKILNMSALVNEFNEYRTKMNEVILNKDNLVIKRLWNLDTNTYAAGALDVKTKELLGLVASMVLRCDDCIKYHLGKSHELNVSTEEMYEVFAVANIVGGTIVVPHTRRAAEYWEELNAEQGTRNVE